MADTLQYVKYGIVIKFREKVFGGLPKHPDLLAEHIERIAGQDDAFVERVKAEVSNGEELSPEQLDQLKEKSWTTFRTDEVGVHMNDYQIKAMLKMANDTLKLKGYTASKKQTIQHGLWIKPPHLHF